MNIFTKIKFVAGAASYAALPRVNKPEFAFWGRSNVGKSSTINSIANNYKIARTSQNPGHTRQINIFNVADQVVIADLPGYGYAATSKTNQANLSNLCYDYICKREIVNIFLLIDSRRGIMPIDMEAIELITENNKKLHLVFTKADLVKAMIPSFLDGVEYTMLSNKKGTGVEKIRKIISCGK